MPTFFVQFEVEPVAGTQKAEMVKGAHALCWVAENSDVSALNHAHFFITKGGWKIIEVSVPGIEVTEEQCEDWDIAKACFKKAQSDGIGIFYAGWSLDGKTTLGPFTLSENSGFDLNEYVTSLKKLANKGRCLHFDSDHRCKQIINAHSIQKSGQLALIAESGHVYAGSADMGDLQRNDGNVVFKKRGIQKMSTFAGFCGPHDSEVFAPIDTQPLIPTAEQAALYAYRSLCREFFVKENALELAKSRREDWPKDHPFPFFEDLELGTTIGFENLRQHKAMFDASMKAKTFEDFEYVVFSSAQKPTLAFSGLLHPDYDFLGRPLQNLADLTRVLDLVTFCSAPMANGWGFLFAWHRSSSRICRALMGSVQELIRNGKDHGDALFRLVVSTCENTAFAPFWWEPLAEDKKQAIANRTNLMASLFAPVEADYLAKGLEGICGWKLNTVQTNIAKQATASADKP